MKNKFLNRLKDAKSRLNDSQIECTARALILLQKPVNFVEWKAVFVADRTLVRSFVIHQIARAFLENKLTDETIKVLRSCVILSGDKCFTKSFEYKLNLEPVDMTKIKPAQSDKPTSGDSWKRYKKRTNEFEIAYQYEGTDQKIKKNFEPLSHEYLLWLLERDVRSLDFANKLEEWLYSFETLLNTNRCTDMKMDRIANIVLAIWRLSECGVEKPWFVNVDEWLTNFIIYRIVPLHLAEPPSVNSFCICDLLYPLDLHKNML